MDIVRFTYQPPVIVIFYQNKSATNKQPAILFSQNKSASAISQTNRLSATQPVDSSWRRCYDEGEEKRPSCSFPWTEAEEARSVVDGEGYLARHTHCSTGRP
jgi:hypothetical protein